ncbi:MAG: ATP-binding protein [Aeromonas popoffii]|uniref:ATP-binding protein n=1 Tax=Aeromonas popoffii TaxID=70856 RepID=UPI003F3C6E5B
MIKNHLLLTLLLAMPVQAMTLPLSPATQAYTDALKPLTICYPALILPPYLEESGGLLIDQLERLAEQLPVPLLHEKLPNWSAVQQGLLAGRCDLIPYVGSSLQVLPGMALSRALLEAESAIVYRGELERGTFLVSPVRQASEVLKSLYPHATQLALTDVDNWHAALVAGKGTAYLGDYLQLRYLMREYPDEGLRLRRLRNDELVISYRLMMRDKPELRELVDTAIRYMPPGSLYKDLGRYLEQGEQDINPLYFTDEEQALLVGTSRTIKLVVDPAFMPYSGIDEQGQLTGWSADVLRRISLQTGLNFHVVPARDKEEALVKLRSGEADMMAGLLETPALTREFDFTRIMVVSRYALVSRKSQSFERLEALKGAVVVPASLYDPDMLAHFGQHEWRKSETIESGIAKVRAGKADAMLAELYQLQYPLRNNQLDGLDIKELPIRFGLGFAIASRSPKLVGVMEQSLMTLTGRQNDQLNQRWQRLVLTPQAGVSYGIWLGSILLALLISTSIIWLIWRSRQQLAREVSQRQEMEQTLALESQFRESLFQGLPVPVFLRNNQGEIIKRNKQAKRLEARYLTELSLPSSQLQGTEGTLSLGDQVFSYAQIPLQLGKPTQAGDLIALSDISALRERTRLLHQAERRLRALTNTVPGAVIQFILQQGSITQVEFISRGSYELLGLASQQIRRDPDIVLSRLLHQDRREMRMPMLVMLQSGQPFSYALRYAHPGKGTRWLQFYGRGRSQPEGGWRVYGVVQDVTARVEQEHALQASHERAEQAVLAKGRFLAAVSHEIRTPMNAILGLLEWLDQTPLSAEQRSALSHVRQAGDELLGLLNDVLDFSRNENRQLALSPQPTDLVDLCEHIAAVHWSKARSKRLQLRLDIDHHLPAQVELDPHRVQQVLHNLLANAIKFSPAGEVVLWARREENCLLCGVDDEGPGISDDLLPRLFLPFEQGGEEGQPRAQGTGLGLAISHQLMEQMGGEIRVEPRPLGGSRFTCTLPLVLLHEAPRWQPKVACVNIQLNDTERAYLLPWLGELGLSEDPTGPLLRAADDDQGLRYWDWQGEPWVPGAVVSLLQPRLVSSAQEEMSLPGQGMRVLLVEDHEVNRVLISMQLTQLGAQVLSAANGQLALDILQHETVDLVLTDLQMPVMDGAQLCQQLRDSVRWQHLPAYVITADLSEQAAQRLASCGCRGHLDKPLLLKDLANLLRSLPTSGDTVPPPLKASDEDLAPEWPTQALPLLSAELVTLYLEATRQDLADIDHYITQGDEMALDAALHKVKGAAKMVGATPLIQVIEQWKQDPRQPLISPLRHALDEVCRRLGERV